jgi:hypothetical protein
LKRQVFEPNPQRGFELSFTPKVDAQRLAFVNSIQNNKDLNIRSQQADTFSRS